jgi:hypothetical protein
MSATNRPHLDVAIIERPLPAAQQAFSSGSPRVSDAPEAVIQTTQPSDSDLRGCVTPTHIGLKRRPDELLEGGSRGHGESHDRLKPTSWNELVVVLHHLYGSLGHSSVVDPLPRPRTGRLLSPPVSQPGADL